MNTLFQGFDGLRLISAISVLFSHAFLIAEGSETREPLNYLLGGHNIIGLYGVFTFFIMSGFLLARSLSINGDAVQFSINRSLRIVPGFIFCLLITTFIIGPLATSLDWRTYFAQRETYDYIANSFLCLCDSQESPFVFSGDPKLASVKNGSLWSLSFEALSYLFLLWLWVLLRVPVFVAAAVGAAALATVFFPAFYKSMPGISYTLPYFSGGVIMYVVYERFGTRNILAWVAFGLLCMSPLTGHQHFAFAVLGSYIIVHLAQRPNIGSVIAQKWGDLSYGLYLFGWPVEGLMKQVTGTNSGWELAAYSLPVALALAALSWWGIEKPCLNLKKALRRTPELNLSVDRRGDKVATA